MSDKPQDPLAWGIAANVIDSPRYFSSGAKVWVSYLTGGEGLGRVVVVGHHRGRGHRYVKLIMSTKRLHNFRAAGIYSPAVYRQFQDEWPGMHWDSKAMAEQYAGEYEAWASRGGSSLSP